MLSKKNISKNKKTYTTKDLIEKFGRTSQRYEQLRNGHYNTTTTFGMPDVYEVKPFLIYWTDWHKIKGHVVFTKSAVSKLRKKFRKKPR